MLLRDPCRWPRRWLERGHPCGLHRTAEACTICLIDEQSVSWSVSRSASQSVGQPIRQSVSQSGVKRERRCRKIEGEGTNGGTWKVRSVRGVGRGDSALCACHERLFVLETMTEYADRFLLQFAIRIYIQIFTAQFVFEFCKFTSAWVGYHLADTPS